MVGLEPKSKTFMFEGEPETKDKTNKAVTEDDPGLNIQAPAPAKPALPLPSPNNVQGFVITH